MHVITKEKMRAMHLDHELTRDVIEKGPYHVLKVAHYDMPWLFSLYNEVKPLPIFEEEFVIDYQYGLIWVKKLEEDSFQIDGFYSKPDWRNTPKFSVIAKKRLFGGFDKVMFTAEPGNPLIAEEAEMAFIYFVSLTFYMNKYAECCLKTARKLKPADLMRIGVRSNQSAMRTVYTVRRPIGFVNEKITINQKNYYINNSRIKLKGLKQAAYFNAPVMNIDSEAAKWLSKLEHKVSNEIAGAGRSGLGNWYKDLSKSYYVKTAFFEKFQLQILRLDSGVFQVDKYNSDSDNCKMSLIVIVQQPEYCHFGILYLDPESGYLDNKISKEAEELVGIFRQILVYSRIIDFKSYNRGTIIQATPIWEVFGKKLFEEEK